ncbi:MAG: hypothetical protein JST52_12745, partial [Bacteroidetes bacterium]|nr:hypothetical protein [Bacteroidota bacterium]
PFARDAIIALQLVSMIKDTNSAIFFFQKSFTCGINWAILDKFGHINSLLNSSVFYKQRVRHLYEIERPKYLQTLNMKTRLLLTNLSHKDDEAKAEHYHKQNDYFIWLQQQSDSFKENYDRRVVEPSLLLSQYRNKYNDSTSEWYNKLKRLFRNQYIPPDRYDSSYVKLTESNILILDSITNHYGYVPGEITIGIVDPELDQKKLSPEDSIDLFMYLTPIVYHILYHHGCSFWMMQDCLRQSVKQGEIHPRMFAEIYEFSYALFRLDTDLLHSNLSLYYKIRCTLPIKDKEYGLVALRPEEVKLDIEKVNKCRKELNICSVEHDREKAKYAKQKHLKLSFGMLNEI